VIGHGLIEKAVVPILSGLFLGLLLGVWGLWLWGLPALFLGLAIGTILIPAWKLPLLIRADFEHNEKPERDLKVASC
jgi:hypothetical protein